MQTFSIFYLYISLYIQRHNRPSEAIRRALSSSAHSHVARLHSHGRMEQPGDSPAQRSAHGERRRLCDVSWLFRNVGCGHSGHQFDRSAGKEEP